MFILKISQNQYINTFKKDIYKKFRKHVQHSTRDLLDPKIEFVRWYRISNWRPFNFCTKKCEIVPNKTASFEF